MPEHTAALPAGLSAEDFEQLKDTILQWQVNAPSGSATLNPLNAFSDHNPACFSLFNNKSRVYLQWEKQPLGINLG